MVPLSQQTASLPDRKGSVATSELVFLTSAPALGFSTYFVQTKSDLVPGESFFLCSRVCCDVVNFSTVKFRVLCIFKFCIFCISDVESESFVSSLTAPSNDDVVIKNEVILFGRKYITSSTS